jgi:hypothetical protein
MIRVRAQNVKCIEGQTVLGRELFSILLKKYPHGKSIRGNFQNLPLSTANISLTEATNISNPIDTSDELTQVSTKGGSSASDTLTFVSSSEEYPSIDPYDASSSKQDVESTEFPAVSGNKSNQDSASSVEPTSIETSDTEETPNAPQSTSIRTTRTGREIRLPQRYRSIYQVSRTKLKANDVPVPTTYKQAIRSVHSQEWIQAMQSELDSLAQHETWKLVPKIKNATIITNKWIYAVKKDQDGYVKRFKARLVVHGYKQQFGVNYFETYAPVVRYDTIRFVLVYALEKQYDLQQYDVKTAFLHGEMDATVYMHQPTGFERGDSVCLLQKSLWSEASSPTME